MIDKGQWRGFGQDTGVTPLFTRSVMGILMTAESQDLGLRSHPKENFSIHYLMQNISRSLTRNSISARCFIYLAV